MGTRLCNEIKKQWAMLAFEWVIVCVLGQLWDVSDSEFVFDCRLQGMAILKHNDSYSCKTGNILVNIRYNVSLNNKPFKVKH